MRRISSINMLISVCIVVSMPFSSTLKATYKRGQHKRSKYTYIPKKTMQKKEPHHLDTKNLYAAQSICVQLAASMDVPHLALIVEHSKIENHSPNFESVLLRTTRDLLYIFIERMFFFKNLNKDFKQLLENFIKEDYYGILERGIEEFKTAILLIEKMSNILQALKISYTSNNQSDDLKLIQDIKKAYPKDIMNQVYAILKYLNNAPSFLIQKKGILLEMLIEKADDLLDEREDLLREHNC